MIEQFDFVKKQNGKIIRRRLDGSENIFQDWNAWVADEIAREINYRETDIGSLEDQDFIDIWEGIANKDVLLETGFTERDKMDWEKILTAVKNAPS